MKLRRLPILLTVMALLLALRWWSPPTSEGAAEVAQAVSRSQSMASTVGLGTSTAASRSNAVGAPAIPEDDLSGGTRSTEENEPRNAFALRTPPPPPVPPPPPPTRLAAVLLAAVVPASAPPVDMAPALPPLQVIGAWLDERGASVFIAGPRGVLQARGGDTLLGEYNVTQISTQQVLLKHIPSNRDVTLAVPAAAGASFKQVP